MLEDFEDLLRKIENEQELIWKRLRKIEHLQKNIETQWALKILEETIEITSQTIQINDSDEKINQIGADLVEWALFNRKRFEIKQQRKKYKPREHEEVLEPLEQRIKWIRDMFENKNKKVEESIYLILYDISDNRLRLEISNYLMECGFQRIQKSVFLGTLKAKSYKKMTEALNKLRLVLEDQDTILCLPLTLSGIHGVNMIGKEINLEFVKQTEHTLFF